MGDRGSCRCCRSAGHETYDSSVQNAEARYLPPFLAHSIQERFYCNRRFAIHARGARVAGLASLARTGLACPASHALPACRAEVTLLRRTVMRNAGYRPPVPTIRQRAVTSADLRRHLSFFTRRLLSENSQTPLSFGNFGDRSCA